jgi:hypothetical protein
MEELSFSKPLRLPNDLALISRRVKGLKPGGRLSVALPTERDAEAVARWCAQTGNRFFKKNSPASRGLLIEIERGKGFHGCSVGQKLSFYAWGVKLHAKELFLKAAGRYPPYLFNFISLEEGLRGINRLKTLGVEFEVLPSPKEVEGYCGFAAGFKDLETCEESFKKLLSEGVGVEVIFKRSGEGFEILRGAWEF